MDKVITVVATILTGLAILVALSALFSFFVMLLWNACLVPAVGVNSISWLQAWGISILCGMLFKSTATKTKG